MTAPVASQAFKQTEKQKEEKGKLHLDTFEGYRDQTDVQENGANEKIAALQSHVCT